MPFKLGNSKLFVIEKAFESEKDLSPIVAETAAAIDTEAEGTPDPNPRAEAAVFPWALENPCPLPAFAPADVAALPPIAIELVFASESDKFGLLKADVAVFEPVKPPSGNLPKKNPFSLIARSLASIVLAASANVFGKSTPFNRV